MTHILNKPAIRKLAEAIEICVSNTGVNPSVVYCLQTGRPIGRFDDQIMIEIFDEIPDAPDNDEEIMDDLLTRTLCSMRPSPGWNNLDRQSLNLYARTRPAETLSYLLIRLYEPTNGLKVDFNRRLGLYHRRIQIYKMVEALATQSEIDLSDWLYMLVEIDAMYNLNSLPVPGNDILLTLAALESERESKPETKSEAFEEFLSAWRKWHKGYYDSYEKRQKQAIRQDQWLKGNPLASSARLTMFMAAKPKSEATIIRESKAKLDNEMTNLLRSIMNKAAEGQVSQTPTVSQPKGFIPAGGLFAGLNLIQKDS